MSAAPIGGIWAAVVTPVTPQLEPDARRAIPYYRELLAGGCDGINLLGTTGEAMSFGLDLRLRFMEAIAASGLPMQRLMAGTGAAALGDAIALTRRALDLGFAAALILPPFFFREASDDGILAYYAALFERAGAPPKRVLLYNFPRMSGVALNLSLVQRIVAAAGGAVAGMKDSANDAALQSALLARIAGFALFPGSEQDLLEAKRRGCAGCISGSVALWPQVARRAWYDGDEAAAEQLRARRRALEGMPLAAAVRRALATASGDPTWERAMPPQLTPFDGAGVSEARTP